MTLWYWFIFTMIVGACVGSFVNVVIYRVPEGISIITPPSRCPRCGELLAWYDNVPVLGWLWLRGRCRYCRAPISVQYPLIEAATALLFGGLFVAYYFTDARPAFAGLGLRLTWPIFAVHLVLIAALLAATIIDARLYIIPLPIPWVATIVAVVSLPLSMWWHELPLRADLVPAVGQAPLCASLGAVAGLLIAVALLQAKLLPQSFSEVEQTLEDARPRDVTLLSEATAAQAGAGAGAEMRDSESESQSPKTAPLDQGSEASTPHPEVNSHPQDPSERSSANSDAATPPDSGNPRAADSHASAPPDPEAFLAHPHPRREVGKELFFVAFPLVGGIIGWWLGSGLIGAPHPAAAVFGGVLGGYLVGGGLIWATRILGTLGFGKEAMGLGDIHLLAAVGAVLGPLNAVFVFFVAPFLGLAGALILAGVSALVKGRVRVVPYGPYLAAATLLVMIGRRLFGIF